MYLRAPQGSHYPRSLSPGRTRARSRCSVCSPMTRTRIIAVRITREGLRHGGPANPRRSVPPLCCVQFTEHNSYRWRLFRRKGYPSPAPNARAVFMAKLPTPTEIRRDNRDSRDKRLKALPIGHLANSFGIYSPGHSRDTPGQLVIRTLQDRKTAAHGANRYPARLFNCGALFTTF